MRFLLIPLGAVIVTGCAGRESTVPLNAYQPITAMEQPAPVALTMADYRIQPLDQLRIDVVGEPDISLRDLPVGANGKIALPLAGEVIAGGLTTAELTQQIGGALNRYLRNPQVAVNVTQYTSQKVTITGSVKAAGMFQAMHNLTLMDAIAMGGGTDNYAKQNEILVFRRQEGKRYVARFDLSMIEAGQLADPAILPGDVVVVGYSNARRLFGDVIAVLPSTIAVFFALLN